MMAFTKCLFSGIATVLLAWFLFLVVFVVRAATAAKALGGQGPVAIAGGWEYLLRKPLIVTLLTLAFGIGFYLCSRRV
jgi:hypothetical protein